MLYYLVYYYFLIVCTVLFSIYKSAQSYIKMLIYLCFSHGFCEESFTEDR